MVDYRNELNNMIISLRKRIYWKPTEIVFHKKINTISNKFGISKKKAVIKVLNYLGEVMIESKDEVEKIIQQRFEEKIIKNVDQARKSVAGSNFQSLVAYSLALNVLEKNVPELRITLKPKNHPLIKKYASIKVRDEIQKPDVDVLIYRDEPKTPIIILSVKTSLRERAGQTYRWKLLLDFATTKCPYVKSNKYCPVNNYNIKYNLQRSIIVSFVTADFYNEISNPQQRGMLSFFDYSYLAKPTLSTSSKDIKLFSEIIFDLQKIYLE